MSTYGSGLTEGGNLLANSDLSAKQFYAVKQTTTARKVDIASTGGEAITGILMNTPKAGEAAIVQYDGYTKAIAGVAGFTAGDVLMTEAATGALVTQSSTNVKVAVAIETAVSGQVALVRIIPTVG